MGRLSSSFQRYANSTKAAPWCRASPSLPLMHRMPIRGEIGFDQWATLTASARQNGSTQLQLEKQLLHYIPYSWIINLQLWSIWVIIKRQGGNAFNCFRKESLSPETGQWMTLVKQRNISCFVHFSLWITQWKIEIFIKQHFGHISPPQFTWNNYY